MSINVEYDEKVEDIHVFIKEPKLEPKIEFDPENPNTDQEVIIIDPLDVENAHGEKNKFTNVNFVINHFPKKII